MEEFLQRFPEVSETAAGSGFAKGLMTAMITLGAFFGKALNRPVMTSSTRIAYTEPQVP